MADTAFDLENTVAAKRDGQVEQSMNGTPESSEVHHPLSKLCFQAAPDAIPKNRDPEMILGFISR